MAEAKTKAQYEVTSYDKKGRKFLHGPRPTKAPKIRYSVAIQ